MSFPCFDSDFIAVKMSSHQTNAKPRSSKCHHFCFLFDIHNYCPTCRESGKGDDPYITNQTPCNICENFSEEQQIKIKHRCRYVRRQKALDPCNTSKDDDLDLLGDDFESSSEEDQSSVPIKKSTKPQQKAPSEPEHQDSTAQFSTGR